MTVEFIGQLGADDFVATPFANLPITMDEWNPNDDTDSTILNGILGPTGDNWDRMEAAHLTFAPIEDTGGNPPTQRNAYKLKIARMKKGVLTVYFQQLASRLGIINGARGGVNIPEDSKRDAFAVGLKYYDKFDIAKEERPIFNDKARTAAHGYKIVCADHEDDDDEKNAEIDIFGDIGWEVWASEFVRDLRALRGITHLQVNLSTNGGGVFEGLAMYNSLMAFPATINITVQGIAASMGSIIALAGNTLEMGQGSFLMIHNPWAELGGEADDLRHHANLLDKIKSQLIGIYHSHTGIDPDKLAKMMDDVTWFNADEAVAAGFADRVVEGMAVAAKLTDRNFSNMPKEARKFIMPKPKNAEHSQLADLLNSLIDAMVSDDRTRDDIMAELAAVEGMDAESVEQLLSGDAACPTLEQLEGFANVLDAGVDALMAASIADGCDFETDGGDDDAGDNADDTEDSPNDDSGKGAGNDSGKKNKNRTAAAYEEGYDAGRAESTKGLKGEYDSCLADHKTAATKALEAKAEAHKAELSELTVERDLVVAEKTRLKSAYDDQTKQLDMVRASLATHTKGLKVDREDSEAKELSGDSWKEKYQEAVDGGMTVEQAILHCREKYPELHKEFISGANKGKKTRD